MGWRDAGIGVKVWRSLVRSGELPVFKVGRAHKARREDVERALAKRRVVVSDSKAETADLEAFAEKCRG